MISNIYITNQNGYNFSRAKKFLVDGGEFKYLSQGKSAMINTHKTWRNMKVDLSKITENDWIIPCGNVALNQMVGFYVGIRLGVLRLLIFDARSETYKPRELYYSEERNKYGSTSET